MQKPLLFDQVRAVCRGCHYSPGTEKTCLRWILQLRDSCGVVSPFRDAPQPSMELSLLNSLQESTKSPGPITQGRVAIAEDR